MKSIQHTLLAIALLSTAGATFAQQNNTAAGRLGVRYIGTSIGVSDYKDSREKLYDTGFGVNLPIKPSLDIDFGYGYSWLKNNPVSLDGHSLDVGATYYTDIDGLKPFASASVAYLWSKASYQGQSAKDDRGAYAFTIGFETFAGPVVLTPRIAYANSFEDGGDGTFNFGIDAHYWITSKIGVRADVSYSDYGSGGLDSMDYRVGLRVKF